MSYKKNIIRTLIIAAAHVSVSFVSDAAVLKGVVCDSITHEGIPYAAVRIFSESDTVRPVSAFATDENGIFSQSVRHGNFTVRFESIGKKTVQRNIAVREDGSEDESMDLGSVAMADDDLLLGSVEVVAMRPIVKAETDRLSYRVGDDSDSRACTLFEMLRKVPMVSVDGEDNISVNGSSDFQVYVNGKQSMMFSANPAQIFKSMPASAVKSIEVITNPGACYDAEGAGGILNLVMDSNGENSDQGYTIGMGAHGRTSGYDANISLSGQKGKLSYSISVMHNKMYPGATDVSSDQVLNDRLISSRTQAIPRMNFSMGSISADYNIDTLTVIGLSGSVNDFGMYSSGETTTDILDKHGFTTLAYRSAGLMDLDRLSVNGVLSFSRKFADRHNSHTSIVYQLMHERNRIKNDLNFPMDYGIGSLDLSDRRSRNLENTLDNILQADFSTHFNQHHTLDTGIKVNLRKSYSSSSLDYLSSQSSGNEIRYDNQSNIIAAYAEYSVPVDIFNIKAGLRYEHTWHKVNFDDDNYKDFSRSYGTLVPSASLSCNFSTSSNIGLTYNMRITRPGISYMNPYVDRSDPTSVSFGNPYLDVESTHNISIAYNLFSSRLMLNTRITDSFTDDGIEQYRYVSEGLLTSTYGNVAKRNYLRIDASAVWMIGCNTRIILNGSTGYVTLSNRRMQLSNHGCQWHVTAGLQQTLLWSINASAYLTASSRTYIMEGFNSGLKILTANLSRTFLNDRLSVSAAINTGLSKGGKMVIENSSATTEFQNRNTIRLPMLSVAVGVSYTIGAYQSGQRSNNSHVESDYIEQRSDIESISGANPLIP